VNESSRATDERSKAQSDGAREQLVAARLRQNASRREPTRDSRVPSFALEHAVRGDLGHLHAAHDLRKVPITSGRRFTGPLIVRAKRALLRGLHPLPQSQSTWNGANARVVTFLLRQLAAQARTIESLERQVASLQDERRR
jgi:hypothetical protein